MHINILASASEYSLTNLDIGEAQTVEDLRQCVLQRLALPTPPRSVRLLHNGCLMQAEHPLGEYQIQEGSTVHMVLRPGTAAAASAPAEDNRSTSTGAAGESRSSAQTAATQFAHNMQNIIATALPNGNLQSLVEAVVNAAVQQVPQAAATVMTPPPPPSATAAMPNRPAATVHVSTAPPPAAMAPPHIGAGQVATVAHIHLHCTLQELEQVPRRIAELRQRMGASSPFGVDTDNFDIRVSAGVQQEQQQQQPGSAPVAAQPPAAPQSTPFFPNVSNLLPGLVRIRSWLRQCLAEAYVGPRPNTHFADKLLDDILHDEPLRRTCRMSLDMVVHEMRNFVYNMLPTMRRAMENEAMSDTEWGRAFLPVGLHAVALVQERAEHWFQHGSEDLFDFIKRNEAVASQARELFGERRDFSANEMNTIMRTMIAFFGAGTAREGDEGMFVDGSDEGAETDQLDDLANELLGEP